MTSKKETIILLLLFLLLFCGVLAAERMHAGEAGGLAGAGRGGPAPSALAGNLTDPASGEDSGAALLFSPEDVRWAGGAPACDAATATVYLPWEAVSGEAAPEEAPLQKEDDAPEIAAGRKSGTEEAAAAFRSELLEALLPVDSRDRIELPEDDRMEDPAAAMREGHAFLARLVKPEGAAPFQIVLTGLPVLCLQKTDAQEIVRKEKHDGLIRLLPPWSADDRRRGRLPATEQAHACSFHVRGNVSSTLDKKPYKIALKDGAGEPEKVRWLDLRRDDDWILNPLYTDSTRVREMTAYALWDETSFFAQTPMPSSRMRYVEVVIDDAWQGIYGLMEPVDRKQLGLSPGDLLYKIDRWNREYPYLDLYDGAEEAGDLEICNDYGLPCVELRYPKSWDRTATWGPMQAFHEFSFRTRDRAVLEEAGLAPDMDSVLSLSLFCAMTHAMDNNWKNSFLIAKKQGRSEGEKEGNSCKYDLFRTIWDLNYVFGDVFVYDPENRYTAFDADTAVAYTPCEDSTWDFEAFLEADPGSGEPLRAALCTKWAVWRKGGISADSVLSLAEGYMEGLRESGALERERKRWPQEEDCDEALEEMEDWIRRRFAYLDDLFSLEK